VFVVCLWLFADSIRALVKVHGRKAFAGVVEARLCPPRCTRGCAPLVAVTKSNIAVWEFVCVKISPWNVFFFNFLYLPVRICVRNNLAVECVLKNLRQWDVCVFF
jgi:hypothetical protein